MENENKTLNYILYTTALFVLLPNKLKEIPFVILGVYSIVSFVKNRKINIKIFLLLTLFFWINLISLLYTNNLKTGFTRIEGFLPFFYLPFSFSVLSEQNIFFSKKFIIKWIVLFNLSNLIFLLIFLVSYSLNGAIINFNTIRDLMDEMNFIGIHSTHLSILVFLAILTCFYLSQTNLYLATLLAIPNIILLGLCGSRAPFIGFVVLIAYLFIGSKIKKAQKSIVLLLIASASFFFIKYNDEFYRKLITVFDVNTYQNNLDLNNSNSIRYAIWNCSIDQIKNSNLLFGNGVGDVRDVLQECYNVKYPNLDKYYNSHNQYFSIILGLGIIGLLSLLIYFFIVLRLNFNKYLSIEFLFYLFVFNFENVLERKYGVLLFLFFSLFVFNLFLRNKKDKMI